MDELQEKVARLPAWAREYVRRLEKSAEPSNNELRELRQRVAAAEERVRKAQDRMDAMTEIFRCAAKGGSEVARAYVERVLREYGIESPKHVPTHTMVENLS